MAQKFYLSSLQVQVMWATLVKWFSTLCNGWRPSYSFFGSKDVLGTGVNASYRLGSDVGRE